MSLQAAELRRGMKEPFRVDDIPFLLSSYLVHDKLPVRLTPARLFYPK